MKLNYFFLANQNGNKKIDIPSAWIGTAPSDAHRHRANDTLALLISLSGDHRNNEGEIRDLATSASKTFFRVQGSVTRAMQETVDHVNRLLLGRNNDLNLDGLLTSGSINIIVLHNEWLFIAQYGSTRTFMIADDQYDEYGALEGQAEALGQNKRAQARFYQASIKPGDLVLRNAHPPSSWSSYYLAGSAALGMEQLKQRLMDQVTGDIEAVVIQCMDGSGDGNAFNLNEINAGTQAESPDEKMPDVSSEEVYDTHTWGEDQTSSGQLNQEQAESSAVINLPAAIGPEMSHEETNNREEEISVIPGETEKPDSFSNNYSSNGNPSKKISQPAIRFARAWMNTRTFNAKFRQIKDRLWKKVFPKSENQVKTTWPFLTGSLAIALPLILILTAITIFNRTGKAEQFALYMEKAQNAAVLAKAEKDPLQKRAYWAQTLDMVKSAEKFDMTQESRLLYEQAQFLLDGMDLAARLDFRPALTEPFPDGVAITRIQASSSGVYLLDKTSGSVLRIYLNNRDEYEIDDAFKCNPGPYGLETITDLVDFVILPANADNYRIMAVDAQGNLLYCRPGEVPVSRKITPPQNGWGEIIGVIYEKDVLYVVDALNDAVWMYAGKDPNKPDSETATGIVFPESPAKFFDEDMPDLGGAIDVAVNQQDLFILHADGHMTQCRYSDEKDVRLTECQDPAPYTDNRVGRENKKPWIFSDAAFIMGQSTRLPNTSIFLLDASAQSIYQFSFQLNLERVLRPQYNKSLPIPDSAPSGFGITPEADVFLAFNNRLFIAPLN